MPKGGCAVFTRLVTLVAVLSVFVAVPRSAAASDKSAAGIREAAERMAAGVMLQPSDSQGGGINAGKMITTVALIGAGVGLAVLGKPDYVPSQFVPGNYPNRVDISQYLGAGTYPGHSYRLVHRRGDQYGYRWTSAGSCPNSVRCIISQSQLDELGRRLVANYDDGYIDGFDDGAFAGAVFGHREGWTDGQDAVIQIMDANGFVVYDGEFIPASYTKEQFSDKAAMRIGGVGLAAAGALIALFWPDSPARNLDLTPMPGGGRVGASFGF